MPPRKSLQPRGSQSFSTPAHPSRVLSQSTQKRGRPTAALASSLVAAAAAAIVPHTTPRRKRGQLPTPPPEIEELQPRSRRRRAAESIGKEEPNAEADAQDGDGAVVGLQGEKELEAWMDFSVDHYEMVEQLPLELHRNYRLLRELDEGCQAQTRKLHDLVREYIALRLKTTAALNNTTSPPATENTIASAVAGTGELAPGVEVEGAIAHLEELEDPIPDGHGGLVLPPLPLPATNEEGEEVEVEEVITARKAFPTTEQDVEASGSILAESEIAAMVPSSAINGGGGGGGNDTSGSTKQQQKSKAYLLLPEIARLSREIVRNGEEKVAVAMGAYNSIDRHIRALDSALSVQEASILLGLRPNTLPTDIILGEPEGPALIEDPSAEVNIGVGGGRGRKKKGKADVPATGGVTAVTNGPGLGLGLPPVIIDADPNEPKYCYCNQVSYGEMIGCDNDDCPLEWFHLSCAGLLAAPTGKWLCDVCKPKASFGPGHTGAASARGGPRKRGGRPSGGRK